MVGHVVGHVVGRWPTVTFFVWSSPVGCVGFVLLVVVPGHAGVDFPLRDPRGLGYVAGERGRVREG